MTGIYQIKDPALSVDSFSYLIQDIFPEFDIDGPVKCFSGERKGVRIRLVNQHTDLYWDLKTLVRTVDARKFHIDIGSMGCHL